MLLVKPKPLWPVHTLQARVFKDLPSTEKDRVGYNWVFCYLALTKPLSSDASPQRIRYKTKLLTKPSAITVFFHSVHLTTDTYTNNNSCDPWISSTQTARSQNRATEMATNEQQLSSCLLEINTYSVTWYFLFNMVCTGQESISVYPIYHNATIPWESISSQLI